MIKVMRLQKKNERLYPSIWRHDWYPLSLLRRRIEEILSEQGLSRSGMRVLDIGCGTAPYKPIFTRLGCEYIGCDLKSEDDQSEVNVFIAPGEKIPLEDASADMVVSFEVLEHVADVDFYLSECRRLLKQGGVLLLSAPGVWLYHPHPTDYRRWTKDGLAYELESRGLEVRDLKYAVGPLAWTTLFRLFGIREVLMKLPLLGMFILIPVTILANLTMIFEDLITPEDICLNNASTYIVLARK